ncbi:protein kinase domain-containing protein [Desulfococcus sp.]|uniref:serine/threonine protein kinase n=1 Tax=Desulfococcus sp. TaxID=2025834 RepID=UPI003D0E7C8C
MIGQQIGPYNILSLLGQGDIGMVYQAVHSKTEQLVAIKVLSRELCANLAMRDRILHQANRQAGLFHPNVVNVLKYLKDNQGIYLVTEYIQGESLEKRLNQTGSLNLSESLRITLKILNAMAFMNKRGIYHRHLKPADILIIGDGNIKVKNFGITKVFGEKGISLMGMRLESLWYMSPEQLRGETVDAASDIYSLGITLYQMLTGQVPFHGKSRFEVIKAHMEEVPHDPGAITPTLPRGLCRLIMKTLSKNPRDRFQSAEELSIALLEFSDDGESGVDMLSGKPFSNQDDPLSERKSIDGENDVVSIEQRREARLFLGRFERKSFYLLMGTGIVLIGILLRLLFFGDSRKQDSRGYSTPEISSPADRIHTADPLPVTMDDETELPDASPLQKAVPESPPAEKNRDHTATSSLPRESFVPEETEGRSPSPASPILNSEPDAPSETTPMKSIESETSKRPGNTHHTADGPLEKKSPASEALKRPDNTHHTTDEPLEKKSPASEALKRPGNTHQTTDGPLEETSSASEVDSKARTGQAENRRPGKETAEPPEGVNDGWHIIK